MRKTENESQLLFSRIQPIAMYDLATQVDVQLKNELLRSLEVFIRHIVEYQLPNLSPSAPRLLHRSFHKTYVQLRNSRKSWRQIRATKMLDDQR